MDIYEYMEENTGEEQEEQLEKFDLDKHIDRIYQIVSTVVTRQWKKYHDRLLEQDDMKQEIMVKILKNWLPANNHVISNNPQWEKYFFRVSEFRFYDVIRKYSKRMTYKERTDAEKKHASQIEKSFDQDEFLILRQIENLGDRKINEDEFKEKISLFLEEKQISEIESKLQLFSGRK